ncbi:MAG: c-type cytochrome [Verrucomicrobia subdivision 3 bacterium]|nr:c-type cytochrome [Limisphaerales bacterium]
MITVTVHAAPFVGAPEPKQTTNAGPLPAQEQLRTFTLPPGFEIELVASESEGIGKFVTVDWDTQGRMWSMTALEYPVDANENPEAAKALYASTAKDRVLVWDQPFVRKPQPPRVFAEGLAIPLGILPYKNGIYVQHGADIVFLSDTDGDGKADKRDVILTGFGVQDSHLFPHQFTRAPGNWIWMAQGAFNYGKVRTTKGKEQQFDQTRMARFRYDGSDFDITSQGPCNIWGLVLTGEGEAFIQEANDYGYPVMPFHAYANYPGCSDAQWKSYAPEFPGTAPHFKMGGTGLSGLALSDAKGAWPEPYADVMYVANPIVRKIQAIKLHRDGPRWRLEKLPDFVQSSDEMFRPVALKTGPDGCLYIVDWYNKIISHNEVPRNHPERDKKRGRIWRVKHREQKEFDVPDFTKLSGRELISKLGGRSLGQHHLAWQAIIDRQLTELAPALRRVLADPAQTPAKRVGALWALEGLRRTDLATLRPLVTDLDRNIRRECIRACGELSTAAAEVVSMIEPLADDPEPEVRAEVIRAAGPLAAKHESAMALCLKMARAPLSEPTGKSTHNGRTIKVAEAYDREFERYLVRLFLEQQPQSVAAFLSRAAADSLPLENRMVTTLALSPRESAARVAQLLAKLERPPTDEELLRLVQFPDEPSVAAALKPLLANASTLEALLRVRTKFDPEKLLPALGDAAEALWEQKETRPLALRLTSAFKLSKMEPVLNEALIAGPELSVQETVEALRAIRELGATHLQAAVIFIGSPNPEIANEALLALASSRNPLAPDSILNKFWRDLTATQQRVALLTLAGTKLGARAIVEAAQHGTLEKADLEHGLIEKLYTLLPDDAELQSVMEKMSLLLRPALRLNGKEGAWVDSDITLDGPFTVETWARLDPQITNADGILGSPGALDINFHDAKLRVWAGIALHDAIIAKKKIAADSWTHVAVTRDDAGKFRLYLNGELDTDKSKPAPQKFEKCRIGWTAPPKGTSGWLTEYRVWDRARTAEEIRADFDRSLEGEPPPPGLVHYFPGAGPWGKLHGSARVEKTAEFPPLLTAAEARAQAEKFAAFRRLAETNGNTAHGKELFTTTCMTCHTVAGQGAQIGPILGGAGAMGTETLLRAVLTPNAAMEAGYRAFRVELKDADVLDGFLVSQDKEAIVLRRPNAQDLRIPQANVRRSGYTRLSMMPEGLLEAMKPEDVTDLFAFLRTLK